MAGYDEHEVAFERGGYALRGTLTRPRVDGAYLPPTAVLVHGSGPSDRDAHLPGALAVSFGVEVPVFRSLARQLAAVGVASLRYDKRNCFAENNRHCQRSLRDYPGDIELANMDDYVADARAAVRYVASRPDTAGEVIVIGHSEGGVFVPHILGREPAAIGGVLLAAPARGYREQLAGQLLDTADYLASLGDERLAGDIAELRARANEYDRQVREVVEGTYAEDRLHGAPVSFTKNAVSWFAAIESSFMGAGKPMLVMAGDMDFNVVPAQLRQYETWAKRAELEATFHLLEKVTHPFVTLTPLEPERPFEPAFSSVAVGRIRDWLAGLRRHPGGPNL